MLNAILADELRLAAHIARVDAHVIRLPLANATPPISRRNVIVNFVGAAYPSLGSISTIFGYHSAHAGLSVFSTHSRSSGVSVTSNVISYFPPAVTVIVAGPAAAPPPASLDR